MNGIICGPSALRYYRTPPQILDLCPMLPTSEDHATRIALPNHLTFRELFGSKLHILVLNDQERTHAKHIKQHLWTGPLPPQATIEDPVVGTVASPLLTLLTLAQHCTDFELAMVMYEFCGEFSVYQPSGQMERPLEANKGFEPLGGSWKRAPAATGKPSSLWMRPPLIELHQLDAFVREVRGRRGARRLERAAAMVQGVTRSPLEVQAAMLLGLPRTQGGRGLELETNATVRLTSAAQRIAHRDYCVADILLTSPDGTRVVDVECQGAAVHEGIAAEISDADRTTALESMGVSVILASHDQLKDPRSFEVLATLLMRKLGMREPPRTQRMLEREADLRRDLFQNWETLGAA